MGTRAPKFRRHSHIGLDIGAAGARAAQLCRSGSRYNLTGSAVATWPAGTAEERRPAAAQTDRISSRLRGLRTQAPFRGRTVVTGLCSPDVTFQALDLPKNVFSDEGTDVDQVIRWEMERLVSHDEGDMEIRYWRLPPTASPSSTAIGVAAAHTLVGYTIDTCRSAGFHCVAVDATATALARFGSCLHPWSDEHVWGILDLGLGESRLVLCAGATPILVRRAGVGNDVWTERIARTLGLGVQAAEVHKKEHGIARVDQDSARDDSGSSDSRRRLPAILLGALRSELRNLASEVKRSYEYVLSCYPQRHASDLVLVGGGASMNNLPEFLSDALGIQVHRASHYIADGGSSFGMMRSGSHSIETLASAVGLAIEGD